MNQNLTEIAIVLDRSGSMIDMAKEAIGGFNGFLESQQKLPGDARLTLALFDHEYIVAHDGRPIKDVPPLVPETCKPPRITDNFMSRAGTSRSWTSIERTAWRTKSKFSLPRSATISAADRAVVISVGL